MKALPFRKPIPGALLTATVAERHVFSFHTYFIARTYRIAGNLFALPVCPTLGDLTGYPIGHGIQEIPVTLCPPAKDILRRFHKSMYSLTVRKKHFCGCAKYHSMFSECAFFWFFVPAKRRIPSRVADAAMG